MVFNGTNHLELAGNWKANPGLSLFRPTGIFKSKSRTQHQCQEGDLPRSELFKLASHTGKYQVVIIFHCIKQKSLFPNTRTQSTVSPLHVPRACATHHSAQSTRAASLSKAVPGGADFSQRAKCSSAELTAGPAETSEQESEKTQHPL